MRPERVLVLGCGSVAQCTVPLLIRDLAIDPQRITIVDVLDNRARVADSIAAGVTYQQDQVTPDNIDAFLSARVGDGDLLLDLAWNIDNPTILQWCRDHGVRYLNTSVEVWDPYDDMASTHPLDRTLYVRHMDLRRMVAAWGDNKGATAVVEHGANPGLVSHFTKQALTEIARRMLRDGIASDAGALERALTDEEYATLAMLTGTKVIHISERDTQITDVPKQVDEFVNTWSVDGFFEEGIAPAELGWGTHEKRLPPNGYVHHGYGPCNQICIARPGMETWVRSWVPAGEIRGMVVRHGEALTISDHLTVWGDDGNPVYRPTVHYAYHPSDAAINSVLELRMRNWEMQIATADSQRRDHERRGRARRAADGPSLPFMVDGLAAVDRSGAGDPAAPERDHNAGRRLDHRCRQLDDQAAQRRPVRTRRSAVARGVGRGDALPGHHALGVDGLGSLEHAQRPLPGVRQRCRRRRSRRPVAVRQLPRGLTR